MSTDIEIYEDTLSHVAASHEALEKAKAEMTKAAAEKKAADERIPRVVQEMIRHNRISPDRAGELTTKLASLAGALDVLMKAADPAVVVTPPVMGRPVPAPASEKAAGRSGRPGPGAQGAPRHSKADEDFQNHFRGRQSA